MKDVDLSFGEIRLIPATTEICDGPYFDWMQDPDVLRHLEARFSDRSHEGLRAFVEGCIRNPDQHLFSICLAADGRHVGNVKLQVDSRHRRGDIGILIGDSTQRGRGLGVQAIESVCLYAFEALGLKKVTAGCYAPNLASIKAFTRAGFVIEATRPSHFVFENARVDGVFMARLNEGSS
ncbi:MAG: GNAT family N-acetyltransferase [Rhodospirillaceae bacterium]|jgi:RimJ/RimL family protein N-acetyltransferase|nr:GNAT family N-acetyltransferase [Rhodospirillaceae bacterium]MBT3808005.1 GNAT family N-acetyltransferase [Rhodospirillaceae bacterium]MBT3931721.1 GNAT family N-acetyltransferase [Rhodospirillaceae bacterium]MBT4773566.1 GNAT family N-acetyltransferase [Rhodospirillaceae bacterium]MBT5358009.1 GNAT family N-acetyltransferase [Rhodospirillaceae bacterium]